MDGDERLAYPPGTTLGPTPGGGWTPVPDPTTLTNAAIERVTLQYRRELLQLQALIETRLTAMDKATELLALSVDRVPSETDKAVSHLQELIETRLTGMDVAIGLTSDGLGRVLTETGNTAASQREVLSGEINAVRGALHDMKDIIETRLAGMDEATKLLATNVDKVPYAILQEAGNLKAFIMSRIDDVAHVSDQRFTAVQAQFDSNALALTAALSAQKEAAVAQNESNTVAIDKAVDGLKEALAANAAQTAAAIGSQAATIADLKDRVVRLESGGLATTAARQEQRADRGESRLNLGTAISIGFLAIALLTFMVLYVVKK